LRLRPTKSQPRLRLVGAEPVAQAAKREPRPRQVIPFPKDRKKSNNLDERLAELRDLRRRLVRLIYDYEVERKNAAQ
jgi:ADP-heptose:LPS heptosyltransferase